MWSAMAILCVAAHGGVAAESPVGGESRSMLSGTVVKVIDGDTMLVQIAHKRVRVHLNGIDAPETGQPWGKEAAAALAQRVLNQQVDLEPVQVVHGGRMTAIVFLGEEELGASLVDEGQAWADREDLRHSDMGLCEAEASAREAKRGLWSLPRAQRIAPWEYRRRFLHPHHTDYSAETAEHCKSSARK